MRTLTVGFPAAILAALLGLSGAGCPGGDAADDDTDTDEPPEECDSFGLQNVSFRFEYVVYGTVYGVDDLIEILAYYALDAAEFSAPGFVTDVSTQDGETRVRVGLYIEDPSDAPEIWIDTWYRLPAELEVPVAPGQAVVWRMMINHRGGVLRLGSQFADEASCLLFYAEPGKRLGTTGPGLAYDNLDEFSQSRVFASVVPVDHDCGYTVQTDCGEQYNLALRFQVTGGKEFEVFPGETATFPFTEDLGYGTTCTGEYEVTDVWSYDWRDVDPSCPDPDGIYERDFAFYVVRADAP